MPSPRALPTLLVTSMLAACGGGAPQPKSEAAAAPAAPSAEAQQDEKSASGADASAEPPPASADTKPAAPASSASGDLAAAAAAASDDPWMAPHQMPPSDVLRTVRAHMAKVNACYHAAKKRDPSVSGDVKIKFVISHEGAVRVWRDESSTMTDPDCTQCVGAVIQGLKFPTQKSPGDAWGIYTINFGG
jgi:hypothetical protein